MFIGVTGSTGAPIARLWRTDGTAAGTFALSGALESPGAPYLDGLRVFVGAGLGGSGYGLFAAQFGVPESAVKLALSNNQRPAGFVKLNGAVYFVAGDPEGRRELWRTDGTGGGTERITQLYFPGDGVLSDLVVFGGRLYFSGYRDFTEGAELFTSDGTAEGTVLFKNIAADTPSIQSSNPHNFVISGNTLYFIAITAETGAELFRSDGTPEGTRLAAELTPGAGGSNFAYLVPVGANGGGDRVVAALASVTNPIRNTFYVSDGTEAGTRVLGGPVDPIGSVPAVSGARIFLGFDNRTLGLEPAVSLGTRETTMVLADLRTGGSGSSNPGYLAAVGEKVYFSATDGFNTSAWVSDSTASGTFAVGPAGTDLVDAQGFVAAGDRVVFRTPASGGVWGSGGAANDAVRLGVASGVLVRIPGYVVFRDLTAGVWMRTDGTVAGTTPLATQPTGATGQISKALGTVGGRTVVAAGNPLSLYGVEANSIAPILESGGAIVRVGTASGSFVLAGGVYFAGGPAGTLWRSDGTTAGTFQVAAVPGPVLAVAAGDRAYYITGGVLRVTDGTNVSVADPAAAANMLVSAGSVAIYGTDSSLRRSDGTPEGTFALVPPGQLTFIRGLAGTGGKAYFSAEDHTHHHQLFVTDGTVAGTGLEAQFTISGSALYILSPAFNIVPAGGHIFFPVLTPVLGIELFALDTAAPFARCSPADISDDAGNPLLAVSAPAVSNTGVNEGDYNAFFNFFFTAQGLNTPADIAFDNGDPLPPFAAPRLDPRVNTGVNEGDYNLFFNVFFNGCP